MQPTGVAAEAIMGLRQGLRRSACAPSYAARAWISSAPSPSSSTSAATAGSSSSLYAQCSATRRLPRATPRCKLPRASYTTTAARRVFTCSSYVSQGFSPRSRTNHLPTTIRSYSTTTPPPPSSPSPPPAPPPPPPQSKAKKRPRPLVLLSSLLLGSLTLYLWDEYGQAQVLQRNLRTAYTGLAIAVDYKLHFDPDDPDAVGGLHQRCADRLFRTCEANAGLFIKLGQAVAANSIVLPPAYAQFTKLFDDVERLPWSVAKTVIDAELATKGKTMDEVFSEFSEIPIAAASVAQVHKARLRSTGEEVAVKVQRPSIRVQTYWDLLSFRILLKFYERIFQLPLSYFGGYISSQIERETHFQLELQNAQRIQKHISEDSSINQTVTVPKYLPDLTSDRLLVMEWIEGAVKMTDKSKIEAMGLSVKKVATDVCNAFAAMIFQYGFVQADGHAGNVLIRKHPDGTRGKAQVVLIDHGLYVELSDKFRKEYAQLWNAIFQVDTGTLEQITKDWGMGEGSSDMFASATLMKPWTSRKHKKSEGQEEDQSPAARKERHRARMTKQKEVLQNFLSRVELVPKELIFVGRSMRIVQANNQTLGSPANRINILARHAADALITTTSTPSLLSVFFPRHMRKSPDNNSSGGPDGVSPSSSTLGRRFHLWFSSRFAFLKFRTTLFLLDTAFHTSRLAHWMGLFFREPLYALGLTAVHKEGRGQGFEDDLEASMQQLARDELGVELRSEAFEG